MSSATSRVCTLDILPLFRSLNTYWEGVVVLLLRLTGLANLALPLTRAKNVTPLRTSSRLNKLKRVRSFIAQKNKDQQCQLISLIHPSSQFTSRVHQNLRRLALLISLPIRSSRNGLSKLFWRNASSPPILKTLRTFLVIYRNPRPMHYTSKALARKNRKIDA